MNRLSKLLLASTCLTAINIAPARAAAVSETEPNNTLEKANLMPIGTTQIAGEIPNGAVGDSDTDFFKLSGLLAGAAFSVKGTGAGDGFEVGFLAEDSSGTQIPGTASGFFGSSPVTGTIPSNGILILKVEGSAFESPFEYALDVSAPLAAAVPEPSSLGLLASGVAGLGALRALWKRRRTS